MTAKSSVTALRPPARPALAPDYRWLLLFRFLSGLPHGAYSGIAALVAVSVAPPDRCAQAVGRVMTGLTVATVIGVPAANWPGQALGWRWGFAVVAVPALTTMLLVALFAPHGPPEDGASPLRELSALGGRQVWLTFGIGAIGFGGLFAVYIYLADTLVAVTRVPAVAVPLVLVVLGLGMTIGMFPIGVGTVLQTRLMDVAEEGQAPAAA